MSRIFLVRHGEVEGNSGPRPTFNGWNDAPLNARGERQAQSVAARLQPRQLRAVYSSDLQRARLTAERIATPHGLKVQIEHAWREVNYGAWSGLGEAEILTDWAAVWQARQADVENVAPPQGESYADLWRRLEPAWTELVARHAGANEDVAVVAHNGTVRLLLCRLLGMPFAFYRRLAIGNCGVSCVEARPQHSKQNVNEAADFSFVVRFVNDTSHLPDERRED